MKFRKALLLPAALLLLLIAVPILFSSATPFCPLAASAQDNPCLSQDATISALQFNNLQLQLTVESAGTALANSGSTGGAAPQAIPVTVIVIVTATPTASEAAQPSEASTDPPTESGEGGAGLEPTVEGAQIALVEVVSIGDIAAEGVILRNDGGAINLGGWTLTDGEGNQYIFPDYEFFPRAQVTLFSRTGVDTPFALYWGLDTAAWAPGEVLTLRDNNFGVQISAQVTGTAAAISATQAPLAITPPSDSAAVGGASLLLSYDARTAMLRNVGVANQDVRTLVMRQVNASGEEVIFTASEWPNADRVAAFRPNDCFQVYTNIVSSVPYVEDELGCSFLQAFRQIPPAKWFWIAEDAAAAQTATFDVLRDGAVIATCPTIPPDRADGDWQECALP